MEIFGRAKEQKLAVMASLLLTALTKVAEEPTEVFVKGLGPCLGNIVYMFIGTEYPFASACIYWHWATVKVRVVRHAI